MLKGGFERGLVMYAYVCPIKLIEGLWHVSNILSLGYTKVIKHGLLSLKACWCGSHQLSSSFLKLPLIYSPFTSAVTNHWLSSLGLCTCCSSSLKCPPLCQWGFSPLGHLMVLQHLRVLHTSVHVPCQTPRVLYCWHAGGGPCFPTWGLLCCGDPFLIPSISSRVPALMLVK